MNLKTELKQSFTSYLNVLLPNQNSETFSICPAEDLFLIRMTFYRILCKNDFQILYGPDFAQHFIPTNPPGTKENEEDDETREQKLKHEFFNWKTKFFDEKKLSNEEEDCPSEFYLAEEFLSIVAKGFRDQEIRFLILFAKSGAVKKEEIATYENYAKSGQYDRCWIVANECTSQSKNFMQRIGEDASSVQMRFVPYAKLKSDWTESIYVHKYQ